MNNNENTLKGITTLFGIHCGQILFFCFWKFQNLISMFGQLSTHLKNVKIRNIEILSSYNISIENKRNPNLIIFLWFDIMKTTEYSCNYMKNRTCLKLFFHDALKTCEIWKAFFNERNIILMYQDVTNDKKDINCTSRILSWIMN